MNTRSITKALALCFAVLYLTGCSKDEHQEDPATLNLRLTDAPASFDEVNVDIQQVEIKSNQGTFMMDVNAGVYNLLDFVNGNDTLFATAGIPAGRVNQIRLILGSNNTVVTGGQSYPLQTPSAQQSGLKLQLHKDLTAGVTYALLLDFDAGMSVVETGNGSYILKPVIRVIEEAQGGAIHGTAIPPQARPLVIAVLSGDSITTNCDTTTGEFLFSGVPAGTYDVSFYPDSPYVSKTIGGVVVNTGALTEMGNISF